MRHLLTPLAVLIALASATNAAAARLFVIEGRGFGHSVGMSQWGAYGMVARDPSTTHEAILSHYFPGTAVEPRADVSMRVLLGSGRSALTVGSARAFSANGRPVAAGDYRVTPAAGGRIALAGVGTFASPIRFAPGGAHLELANARYRGYLDVRSQSGLLDVRNAVSRELYLQGVVPREVYLSWYPAVFRAQAVAARSWAMRARRPIQWFDVYPDTRSQVYGGVAAEYPSTNEAVVATRNQVLTYGDAIAEAVYHSSSGGKTASSVDVWGGNVPYLTSVDDPDDLNAANPHRLWRLRWSPAELASRLGTRVPRDATLTRDGSDLAQTLTVSGSGWSTAVNGSETLRSRLRVKSARFRIGVLSLTLGRSRVTHGGTLRIWGLARRVQSETVYLQQRPYGGSWTRVAAVASPSWVASAQPTITTSYRLVSSKATLAASTVSVATAVRFATPAEPYTQLKGTIGPARSGVAVTLQRRRSDGTWRAVQTTTTASGGAFAFAMPSPGTYRAIADAGSGYLLGASRALTLVAR